MDDKVCMQIFKQALSIADKQRLDMSDADWAQAIGVMHNYGHGYKWDLPKNTDGFVDKAALIRMIESYAEENSPSGYWVVKMKHSNGRRYGYVDHVFDTYGKAEAYANWAMSLPDRYDDLSYEPVELEEKE